ncbi:MAG: hypothetical protein Q9205_002663 [Flavoplaca limonia]
MTATTRTSSFVPDRPSLMSRSHRRKSRYSPDERRLSSSSQEGSVGERKPNVEDLRRVRAEYYTTAPGDRHFNLQNSMAERSTSRRNSTARIPPTRPSEVIYQAVQHDRSSEHRHRRRRTRAEEHDSEPEHVYVYDSKPTAPEPPGLQRSRTSIKTSTSRPIVVRQTSEALPRNHSERRKSRQSQDEITVKRIVRLDHGPESESPRKNHRSRHAVTRAASTRDTASIAPTRPSLLRSQTTTRRARAPPPSAPFSPSINEPSPSVASRSRRSSGFFGSILGIPKDPPVPEKRYDRHFNRSQFTPTYDIVQR